MSQFEDFKLNVNFSAKERNGGGTNSSNPCWSISTYISNSVINGGCMSVNKNCSSGGGASVCTPCSSSRAVVR
ncbi:hypothetical protein [Lagierella sp.]|uniref:hypothetical protein n=1 Tax=Lagierella sp. TaxID=2849657 RepID=UPI0026046D07|nr:hypothetical protein [Lagierella sp.]